MLTCVETADDVQDRMFADSLLEGNGFEISVPRRLSPPPTSWVAFISAVSCGT